MSKKQLIVGIGELLWDMFPEGKQLGGAPANFAYHASQLGCNSFAVSAIGNDMLGYEIEEILSEKNVNSHINHLDFPTGTVQVTVDSEGIPSYEIKRNVAWDHIRFDDELKHLASKTSAVCFGSLAQRSETSRNSINQFLNAMSETGVYKIFDINLRQNFYNKAIIENSLQKSNILKLNDDELLVVTEMFGNSSDNLETNCQKLLLEFDLEIVILTCGTKGSYVFTKETTSFLETPKVQVADTVGAGDSFTAAFCVSLLDGKSISLAHEKAVEVSAFVCTKAGAMPNF